MSNKVVLHIGLPKTATTFLQRDVLGRNLEGSISTPMWNQAVSTEIVEFIRGKRSTLSHSVGKFLSSDRAFVSHEDLSLGGHGLLWNQNFRLTPGRMLGGLLDLQAQVDGQFVVLVTLRRQDEWLASAYAESGPALDRPGQLDFERRVSHLIEVDAAQRRWFEYYDLVSLLQGAFGESNVHVLLQEQLIHSPFKWEQKLKELLGERASVPDLSSLQKRNARRADESSWTIRKSDRQISLGEPLSSYIMKHFAKSNESLGKMLDVDMVSLGYLRPEG